MKVAIIVSSVVGFLAVLTAFVILTLSGKDTAGFVGFATSAAVFLVPQLVNMLKTHATEQAVKEVQADVSQVKERTNGPLDHMQQQINELHEMVSRENGNAGSS